MSKNRGQKHLCLNGHRPWYDFEGRITQCSACADGRPSTKEEINKNTQAAAKTKPQAALAEDLQFENAEEEQRFALEFFTSFPSQLGLGGLNAQASGKRNEISVGDILYKAKISFSEQYPLRDVKGYGRGTWKLDQLIRKGLHPEDCPADPNPKLGFPVAALLENKFQEKSGTAYEKLDHAIRRLALCCQFYNVRKARIIVAGKVFTNDIIQHNNKLVIPDTKSCDGLDIQVIRLVDLWRRVRDGLPL